MKLFLVLLLKITFVATLIAPTYAAAQETPSLASPQAQQPADKERQQQVMRSMQMMLKRAQLTRTLAAEHLDYIKNHRDQADIRLIEDASQVMAFDLICEDEKMEARDLNQIAADTSFRIAMMAGTSTIGARLTRIAQEQTIKERMHLIGDIATTVLMFEVGRRRGLFDALLTDFGKKRFCSGMQTDMRNRYNDIIATLSE